MFKIIDNFYEDPAKVRRYALSQDFTVTGNYPGRRTGPCPREFTSYIKGYLEGITGEKITYFPDGYNSAFQLTLEGDNTWIHYDQTKWAAVVYLTPDAPLDSGTGIFRHRSSGIYKHNVTNAHDFNEEPHEQEDWDLIGESKNLFNRMVLYHGKYYHRSMVPGFGSDKYNGRLFQTFFFD